MKPYIQLPESTYFGGKSAEGTVKKLINFIPKHQTFISGFLGLCGLMKFKKPARFNIGIEINPKTVAIWKKGTYLGEQLTPANLMVLQQSFFQTVLPSLYHQSTFLYLDPPYTHQERKSNHRYSFELTMKAHEQLLDIASSLPCRIMISCYDNPLYQDKLKNWRKESFEVVTRGGTMATETVYMNYARVPPNLLHDTRFLGDDYRKREVTKKRLNTLFGKIERLQDSEKAMFFARLKKEYPLDFSHHDNIATIKDAARYIH